MRKIQQILNDLISTGSISPDDYNYLQEHTKEAINTGNLELIELATNADMKEPEYRFQKVIF